MSDSAPSVPAATVPGSRAAQIPKPVIVLLLAASLGCFLLLLSWSWSRDGLRTGCDMTLGNLLGERGCTATMNKIFTYAWALALVPVLLLLERLNPADPDQPLFSRGLLVDSIWFVTFPILGVWLPNAFEHVLHSSAGVAIANFRLQALTALPLAVQFLLVILVADFLAWFSHYLRHRIPSLWEMHKIHHSQVQLNVFSTRRLHPLDLISNSLIRFLPWTLLGLSVAIPGYLTWSIILRLWEMVVHSNLRTSLGPLRYLIVTPQTHRIHHSLLPQHIDKNFGNFFSIWDFMFRTQCLDFHIYPPLGISDAACPKGGASTISGALRTFGRELWYPLRSLRRLPRSASLHGAPAGKNPSEA